MRKVDSDKGIVKEIVKFEEKHREVEERNTASFEVGSPKYN